MRYFSDLVAHKASSSQGREGPVEISVHCDVDVFDWLVRYVTGAVSREHLSVERVLALLIAGNFLQMERLVADCLSFMAQHLSEVVRLQQAQQQGAQAGGAGDASAATAAATAGAGAGAGASGGGGDLTALPLELLSRLAQLVPEHVLEDLVRERPAPAVAAAAGGADESPRHALVNKLYKYKLEGCLRELRTTLARCSVCQGLFSLADRGKLECPGNSNSYAPAARGASGGRSHSARGARSGSAGGGRTSSDGRAAPAVHIPDASWRLQDYLSALRAAHAPWRDIYWHVWGLVHVLHCHACHQHVPAAGLRRCTYHPQAPIFSAAAAAPPPRPGSAYAPAAAAAPATASGFYPCCGAAASRTADPRLAAASGCCAREHRLLPSGLGPGAPLPPGLTPALLDTLRRFPDLFTDAADAPPPRVGATAWPGRTSSPRAGDGAGGEEAVAGAMAGAGEHARAAKDHGEGRDIPPSIRAVLDAAAASAAASAAARKLEAAAGTTAAAQGLGPAAAAAAAALGYHVEPGSLPGGGTGSSGKGARTAVAAAPAAVPGSPISLTGDPQLDARLVAAAVARRLTNSSGGGGGGASRAAGATHTTGVASGAASIEAGNAHRHGGGADATHMRSFTSVAMLQQEAEEAGAAPSGGAAGFQPHAHAPGAGSAPRAKRASSARYSGADGAGGGGQEGGWRSRPLTAGGQVPAAYLSSPYLPRPGAAKKPGRSSSLDAALAKELQKLAVKLQDAPRPGQTAAPQQRPPPPPPQPVLALRNAGAGGAQSAAADRGLPPRPQGSRTAIQVQAEAEGALHAGAAAAGAADWESDEDVYTDDDYEQGEDEGAEEDSEGAEGEERGPASPGGGGREGNPLHRSVQAALARAQQRRHEQAQVQVQEPCQPPHGLQADHQHKHVQRQLYPANQVHSRSPPPAAASPPPPRHPPAASPPVSPTPPAHPEQGSPGAAADAQAGRSAAQARSPGPPGRQPDAAAAAAAAAVTGVSSGGPGRLGAAARPGPPLLHSAPAAPAAENPADAERRQLIEAYKTQAVLSPRPAHYQMISIADLPSGGDLARGAGAGGAAAARLRAYRTSALGAALAAAAPGAAAASVDLLGRPGGLAAAAGGAPAASASASWSAATAQSQALARTWGPEASAVATAAALEPGMAAVAASRAGFFSLPHPDYDSDSEAAAGRDGSGGGAGAGGVSTSVSSSARGKPDAPASAPAAPQAATAGGAGPVSSDSGPAASGGAKGRKLRMELLYEDDNYRMDLLLKHLLACRPSTRTTTAANSGAGAKPVRAGGGGGNSCPQRSMSRGHASGVAGRPLSAAPLAPSGPGASRQRARSVSRVQRLANLYQPAPSATGWRGPDAAAAAGAGVGGAMLAPGDARRPISAATRSFSNVNPAAAAVAMGVQPGVFAGGGSARPELQGPYGSMTWQVDAGATGGPAPRALLPRTSSAAERRPVSAPRPRR
ncbi:hypothetical protein HXX76_005585 [Chlamydomonas incerta]|uniref:SANT and BTB domain-containing protein n=1 Tax=Chlamydomonas incerta TaxID=51695 RepID=A0A835TFV5_CHLIN|nr:hypothetical protein HXX76_005585 [Chlamydomonas incerta]|eukprot:KAG2437970.1 hypothetical protein HXX76_005585 [Chlamydomonas incerta]